MKQFIKEKLYSYPKAYIMLDDLLVFLNCKTYREEYNCISELISDNVITPVVKKNSTNGKTPVLYLKYRIHKPTADNSDIISEIQHLEESFHISYYLENINKYKQQRDIILPLSDFLKKHSDRLVTRISKNERAYQIWNYEKALDSSTAKSVIKLNNLYEKLNYYNTPEPFFYYTPECNRFAEKTVLIIENKDTWYSIREIMRNRNKTITLLGYEIDGILYGEGKKITRENVFEDFCETKLIHRCKFLYFGDLDYEGIGIFQSLKARNKDFDLQIFSELYTMLIDLKPCSMLGKVKTEQKPVEMTSFLDSFDDIYSSAIKQLLAEGRYIPQEAMNKDIFEELIKFAEGKND